MTTARPVRWCQRANGPLMARKINNYRVKIKQQAMILRLTWVSAESGRRESNPHDQLGRLELYH